MKHWNVPGVEVLFAIGQLAVWGLLWAGVSSAVLVPVGQTLSGLA